MSSAFYYRLLRDLRGTADTLHVHEFGCFFSSICVLKKEIVPVNKTRITYCIMDFQAVVMAAGKGSRMTELTMKCPKALLPIGNRPMIWYSLNFLQRNHFKDVILVLPALQKAEIMQAIAGMSDIKLQLHEELVQQSSESGTADSLREIIKKRDIKKNNLLVVSCDIVTNVSLDPLFALHYSYCSAASLLFAPLPTDLCQAAVPGPKTKQKFERDLVGLDSSTHRLVFMTAEADCDEEELILRRHALNQCPNFTIHSNLLDAHVYIFGKAATDLLINEKKLSSLKGDVIPLAARRQFAPVADKVKKDPVADKVKKDHVNQIEKMSSWMTTNGIQNRNDDLCYGYIDNDNFCFRANNLATYMYANRQIARLWPAMAPDGEKALIHSSMQKAEDAMVGTDTFIGKNVVIGAKSVVKGSSVGQECKIGANVKLTNCIIMDKVTIADSCILLGCIICREATIEIGCHLKHCVVATDHLSESTESSYEIILSEGRFMDLSDTDSLS